MRNKINYCKFIKFSIVCSIMVISLLMFLTSCIFFPITEPRMKLTYRFSIKNETNFDLDVKLAVGEIPCLQARFDEFTLVPDELYKLGNEIWSNDLGTHCTIKPTKHDAVVSFLPIAGLCSPLDTSQAEYYEKQTILRENLLNKFFSFVLTISRNGGIIYRIVGWDVPDEDMEKFQITDKSFGYYHTAPENYVDSYGGIQAYPKFFYSKSLQDEIDTGWGYNFTYYIKTTTNKVSLQEFVFYSTNIDEDKYWKEH